MSEKVKKVKKPLSKDTKRSLIIMGILAVLAIGVWIVERFVLQHKVDMSDVKGEMFPPIAFELTLFGQTFAFSSTIVSGFITSGVLIVIAILYRVLIVPKFKTVPTGIQSIMEYLVSTFNGMAKSTVGHYSAPLGGIVFGLAAFICVGTLMEMLGIRPPSADINACAAMALTTFILINFYGLKEKGLGKRLKRYILPIPLIPLITDIAVPVSMTFRLFGSILSGFLIMSIIYAAMPAVLPGFLSIMFTLFHALIQSYIFAVLSLTFIGEAVE